MTADFISKAVVCDINHDKKIRTTNRFFDVSFTFTCTETDDLGINQERRKAVTLWNCTWLFLCCKFFTEFYKFLVNLLRQILTSFKCYDTNRSGWS